MHDLTRDNTPLSNKASIDPVKIINHTTPFLDLHSLYGAGPFSGDHRLYQDDHASFRLGLIESHGVQFDLPIDSRTDKPLLADSRNNENLILRQIHAMFLKLHNAAVAGTRGTVEGPELFETARRRVQLQYQWIVRDFLVHVCKSTVYDQVVRQQIHTVEWDKQFAMPVEFAHAVARFGHSMVRADYDLNADQNGIPLSTIFRETRKKGALKPDYAIDWSSFFFDTSNSIDTSITGALFQLGPKSIQPFVKSMGLIESLKLPVRTLNRHIMMRLPTGEEVRDFFDPTAVLDAPTGAGYNPYEALDELGLRGKTPLWYYILLEAELNEKGANLGTIGSHLILEVIEGSLRATPDSILTYLQNNPRWRPDAWKTEASKDPVEINTLFDLAVVVGLATDDADKELPRA